MPAVLDAEVVVLPEVLTSLVLATEELAPVVLKAAELVPTEGVPEGLTPETLDPVVSPVELSLVVLIWLTVVSGGLALVWVVKVGPVDVDWDVDV